VKACAHHEIFISVLMHACDVSFPESFLDTASHMNVFFFFVSICFCLRQNWESRCEGRTTSLLDLDQNYWTV